MEEARGIRRWTQRNGERKIERGKRKCLWTDVETDVDFIWSYMEKEMR